MTHRNHALKFGFEISPEQNNDNLSGMARPLYVMHNLWNFPNDTPTFEQIDANPTTGGPADAQRYLRSKDISFFVQDDWKVRPDLTLSFGLRYAYFTPLSDAKNRLTNLEFGAGGFWRTPPFSLHRCSRRPRRAAPNGRTLRDAGPRFGFAWSPSLFKGTTVVRGGAGVVCPCSDKQTFVELS
jgi:outer membrane receptor protein involved in Fe transport